MKYVQYLVNEVFVQSLRYFFCQSSKYLIWHPLVILKFLGCQITWPLHWTYLHLRHALPPLSGTAHTCVRGAWSRCGCECAGCGCACACGHTPPAPSADSRAPRRDIYYTWKWEQNKFLSFIFLLHSILFPMRYWTTFYFNET